MTGKKSYKEKETEQKFGKKRYLERVIEEQEAEQEIKDYDRNEPLEGDVTPEVHSYTRSDK